MHIVVQHLSKYFPVFHKAPGLWGSIQSLFYRKKSIKHALTDISVEINSGNMVALLGPNGSGKTTLMKIISGVLIPSSGTITANTFVPGKREKSFLKQISLVMGQRSQLWWDLPTLDSLQFFQAIYEIPRPEFENRLKRYSELLAIDDLLRQPVRKLSLGQRMRCEFLASILHHPQLLLLDEPTIGLDIISQQTIRQFLAHYHSTTGSTIILTSHNMQDIANLCERAIILQKSRIVFDNQLATLHQLYSKEKRIQLTLAPGSDLPTFAANVQKIIHPNLVIDLIVPYNDVAQVAADILAQTKVVSFTIHEPTLEEIIRQFFLDTQNTVSPLTTL